SPVSS
ncbi:his Kinase A domain protein, partial [Vibrio parahaemolyticus V-223/04]